MANRKRKRRITRYDSKLRPYNPVRKKVMRASAGILTGIGMLASVIYLPQYVLPEPTITNEGTVVRTDAAAVNQNKYVVRNCAREDFDGDGLLNEEEEQKNGNLWNPDGDGDGLSDAYEVRVSRTDPSMPNNEVLPQIVENYDRQNGKSCDSPYTAADVVLRADSYTAKGRGGVLRLNEHTFRFCGFTGWAVFPEDSGNYAYYRNDSGDYELLTRRAEDRAWRIPFNMDVFLTEDYYSPVTVARVFGTSFEVRNQTMGSVLSKVLPLKGWITAKTGTPLNRNRGSVIEAEIRSVPFDAEDYTRLKRNDRTEYALELVKERIRDGGICTAVSLYREGAGEFLGIVYGYTPEDGLLIADASTLEPAGTLACTKWVKKLISEDGTLSDYAFFTFTGLGFSSGRGDRISLFACGNAPARTEDSDDGQGAGFSFGYGLYQVTEKSPSVSETEADAGKGSTTEIRQEVRQSETNPVEAETEEDAVSKMLGSFK